MLMTTHKCVMTHACYFEIYLHVVWHITSKLSHLSFSDFLHTCLLITHRNNDQMKFRRPGLE